MVGRLCTALSVGPVTAAAFSSTVDDAHRFKSAHQVEANLGLTPSEWSSGEKQCKGHITKAGNNRMRRLLVQVAVSILRLRSPRTEALRKWATGIAALRGRCLARPRAGLLRFIRQGREPPVARTRLIRPTIRRACSRRRGATPPETRTPP